MFDQCAESMRASRRAFGPCAGESGMEEEVDLAAEEDEEDGVLSQLRQDGRTR